MSRTQALLLCLLFAVAFAIRIFGITDPPLEFHPTKQFRSALTTRAYFYELSAPAEPWRAEVAQDNLERIGVIVPTPQEKVIAWLYQVTGGEKIWIGRLFSVVCWLVGGQLLFVLTRRVASFSAALLGTSFYLLLPFSVIASQSYQPDPLMVLALVASIYASVRFHEQPTLARYLIAAAIGAAAVFIKPISIFLVVAGYVGSYLGLRGSGDRFRLVELLVFLAIAVLPSVAFYVSQIPVRDQAGWGREASFLPGYVLEVKFWDDWLKRLRISVGITYFIAGLVGALIARRALARPLLVSLWAGYFVMCFAITYKISTHDYYHLPLIPVIALGLAQLADIILEQRTRMGDPRIWGLAVWGATILGLFIAAGTSVQARRRVPNFDHQIAISQTIGEHVRHSMRVLFLTPDYGHPLMYYGQLSGRYWPYWYDIRDEKLYGPSPRSAEERYAKMTVHESFDFFVVTDLEELRRQADLLSLLRSRFRLLEEGDGYLVYDLRQTTLPDTQIDRSVTSITE